jgi:large subunit ribosomal protein L13
MKKETPTFSQRRSLEARRWHLVDAKDKTVGRLASALASILRGKDNPAFSPHIDNGDFIVVINARHIKFTGNKLQDKRYYRHTGYPGGIRSISAGQMLKASPEDIIRKAVSGMLPKNAFGRQLIKKLKVYPDVDHRHNAQSPVLHS